MHSSKIKIYIKCLSYSEINDVIKKLFKSFRLKYQDGLETPMKGSGHSSSTNWGFDEIEKKHTLYRGKDCIKKFCDSLKEHAKQKLILK